MAKRNGGRQPIPDWVDALASRAGADVHRVHRIAQRLELVDWLGDDAFAGLSPLHGTLLMLGLDTERALRIFETGDLGELRLRCRLFRLLRDPRAALWGKEHLTAYLDGMAFPYMLGAGRWAARHRAAL